MSEEKSELTDVELPPLEEDNKNLENQINELQKTSSVESNNTTNVSSNPSPNSSSTTATSDKKSSASNTTTNSETNSQMVWVGDTGTKYHIQSCRTLKGKGHQITLQQALAEGREPCKVCH